ncbi:hypothetical protein EE612_044253 [Oryza sativa]|uniref:Uncharacterized protein n=2 Tax=Oryza TaxID=4527 RepID=A2YV67_ORYSI|nr:uncharacterized protein LOC127783288 [Oryza glaberrima]EAZ06978.1 hypothetical protein OsI_29221 [Oryza sativa Indica Group]KAB8108493.1 hypothetical protein EE612_044253 [Oryza sativa]KAF2919633.1 hypothetical protein DAI22_08g149800 [Oryza sativa Japonica Group]
MARWPRPALLLLLVAVLLLSHIALCSSAAASGKPKGKGVGGRKALLADDGGEEEEVVVVPPPVKKAKGAAAAVGKIKKKVVGVDGKNQTKVVKGKKSEPAGAVKATKKLSAAAAAKASADAAVVKAKVPKTDKAATAKSKGTDTAKPAKVAKAGSAKAVKPVKPVKTAKSESGVAAKAKKASNSTVDGGAKQAKSSKKAAQAVVDGEASGGKVNATASNEAAEVEEDVVFAEAAEGTDDLISEFKGLPARLQETLMPDLARLSHSSKLYLSAANAGIADGVRPILGGRWAAAAASAASIALLLLPLFMLTALVRRMAPYLPLLHRALLLAQAYLAIYFATLALAAAATGLEPLRFFHAASPAAYAWTQAAQSLGFMGYLMLQMVDLVAVFSGAASPEEDGNGDATKALGLAQMVVGLAVGLHYYAAVFHRAAAGEAPRANWRVYAVYAACFVVVCACARAERRKKAYLAGGTDGGAEEWKKS